MTRDSIGGIDRSAVSTGVGARAGTPRSGVVVRTGPSPPAEAGNFASSFAPLPFAMPNVGIESAFQCGSSVLLGTMFGSDKVGSSFHASYNGAQISPKVTANMYSSNGAPRNRMRVSSATFQCS